MARLLVTGGAGFIGSNFIRYWSEKHPSDSIVNLDSLSYAGDKSTVRELNSLGNVRFVKGDICNAALVGSLTRKSDIVFHFAAETHVDRSILDSQIFLKTNALGAQVVLECARKSGVKRFVFVSTDEVYGSIRRGSFSEESPLAPNSPYAASKAAADMLCRSYWVTYRMPVLVTRCCNNFGPYQYPEKVIPLFVTNLLDGRKIPVYGKGANVREWIYVTDHCSALDTVSRRGKPGEVYNVGSGMELKNIDLARALLKLYGKTNESIEFVKDRPGHDFRYSLNWSKLRLLGWKPAYDFNAALTETADWYRSHGSWWRKIKEKSEYGSYMKSQYSRRKI